MIRVVFFDIDNTLLSFSGYVRETMKSGFELFGLPPYRESMFPIFEKINGGLWRQLEEGSLTFEELIKIRWDRIFKALDISFDGRIFEDYFRKQLFFNAVLEPGAIELLEYLKGRHTLCIASNGPYEQQINRLRIAKLYDYFSHFFVSERTGAAKPKAEFFDFCFKELRENGLPDLLPEETMIIGDSVTSDIIGGKAYGIRTCLYIGNRSINNADAEMADHVAASLSDIRQFL